MAVFRTSRAIAGIVNVLTNVWFLSVESVRNRAPLKRDIIVATEVGSECRFLAGFDYLLICDRRSRIQLGGLDVPKFVYCDVKLDNSFSITTHFRVFDMGPDISVLHPIRRLYLNHQRLFGIDIILEQVFAEQALGQSPFRRKQVRSLEVGVHPHYRLEMVILDALAGLRVVGDDFPAAAATPTGIESNRITNIKITARARHFNNIED